ncbi:unnamed protein product [Pleuronectes platessa]|uniref:Uncharacterized protein n=1 Tax=Pleuronectes platessa TaxID=8262 RepID=A0A9N7Z610_PLEPL|nr:unnamed protein product [Pleuronectes platessa]
MAEQPSVVMVPCRGWDRFSIKDDLYLTYHSHLLHHLYCSVSSAVFRHDLRVASVITDEGLDQQLDYCPDSNPCLPACLPACPPACLPPCLPACLPLLLDFQ